MGCFPARQRKRKYVPLLSDFASFVHLSRNNPHSTNKFFQKVGFGAPGRFNDFCLFSLNHIFPRIGAEVTVGCLGVVSTHYYWPGVGKRRNSQDAKSQKRKSEVNGKGEDEQMRLVMQKTQHLTCAKLDTEDPRQ